jgi:hypothetical protein
MRLTRDRLARLMAGAAVAAGLVAGLVVAAGPADAEPGLVRTTASTVTDSTAAKAVAANCPAGTRVIGGGGEVVGGSGQVVVNRLQPEVTASRDRFVAGANEDEDGFTGTWRLTAYAICAAPLPNQQVMASSSATDSATLKSSLALCPGPQIGVGGRVTGGAGQVRLTDLFTFFDLPPSITFARAVEDSNGFLGNWSITSYAVCADTTTQYSTAFQPSAVSSVNKSATATCPAGTRVHGVGGQLVPGTGPVNRLVLDRASVDAGLSSVTVRGVEDQLGTTGTWSVTAIALCAP